MQILDQILKEMKDKINNSNVHEEQRNRLKFDFTPCESAIYTWKAHLLRTVLQEKAKQTALNELDSGTCLIILDWAMKFLPLKFRENMCELFGKRGRSWHASAVVTKKDDQFEVLRAYIQFLHSEQLHY